MLSLCFVAYAGDGPAGFDFMSLLPIALIFVVFYFLIFRPQQKKTKTHQEMVKNIKRGDKVLTTTGLYAVVDKVLNDQEVLLEIADGVKVRFVKNMLHEVAGGKPLGLAHGGEKKAIEDKSDEAKPASPKTIGRTKKTLDEQPQHDDPPS